jgi:phage replication O-like protein O
VASPQLEQGHVRIANALLEALLYAKFSATQQKIVYCVMRLSWGWRARTVRITHAELAVRCNTSAAGGFRKEFAELVRNGVIIEVDAPHGRTPGAYAINKDFEKWGRFSVPPGTLAALFRERPDHADTTLRVPSEGHSNEGDRVPSEGQATDRRVPSPVLSTALLRAPKSTGKGSLISASRCETSDLDPGKDSRKTEKDITAESNARATAAAAVGSADEPRIAAYAESLAAATNAAITERWGRQEQLIQAFGITRQIATELLNRGVSIELATSTIAEKVRLGRFNSVPVSVNYFAKAIVEAYQDDVQRRRDRDARPLTGALEPVSQILDRERQEQALQDAYVAARAQIVAAWRADLDHAEHLAAIEAEACNAFPERNPFSKPAREAQIVIRIARAAGFPDFDAWRESPAAKAS